VAEGLGLGWCVTIPALANAVYALVVLPLLVLFVLRAAGYVKESRITNLLLAALCILLLAPIVKVFV
jgi:FtsH-binding integral membrane protein